MQTRKQFTYIFFFALLFWSVVVSVMLLVMLNQERVKAEEIALSAARSALTQDKIFRFWATSHGGLYVPITKKTQPNVALAHLPHRDLYLKDRNLTLMNPAYALRQMMSEYEGLYGLKGHITSLKLLNPNNAPDAWEGSVLEDMENGDLIEEKYIFIKEDNIEVLRMLEPLIIKEGCLKCHAHQGYKIGDVRGGVTVMLPMREINKKKEQAVANLIMVHIIFWLFGIVSISYFYKKIVQSISTQKKLNDELHKKEEIMIAQSRHAAMGEMISMIAHQWRQPITVISMVANNLLADVEFDDVKPENVKKSAVKVLEQSHHLSQTIDDFKNFFRPNKKTESVLVNDVLEENFKIIGKSLENNNINIEKKYESFTKIEIYSRELLQVFINILKNAKEALVESSIENPTISVATSEDKEYVYIVICDNGKGINPAILSKIYDPYFTTKDEKIGTGLGLYMTKIIIHKHLSGNIKAFNIQNSGVCFEISLPKRGVNYNE